MLFVVGKTNSLQGLSLCQVFCFNVLKFLLTINISFFFVRFVILKVQNIMAVKPPSIFLRRTLISYLHSCR